MPKASIRELSVKSLGRQPVIDYGHRPALFSLSPLLAACGLPTAADAALLRPRPTLHPPLSRLSGFLELSLKQTYVCFRENLGNPGPCFRKVRIRLKVFSYKN